MQMIFSNKTDNYRTTAFALVSGSFRLGVTSGNGGGEMGAISPVLTPLAHQITCDINYPAHA